MATVRLSIEVDLDPAAAFETFADELTLALERSGIRLEGGLQGRVVEGVLVVGEVTSWVPGERISLRWHPADWRPDEVTDLDLQFEPRAGGTVVTLEHRGLERLIGDAEEVVGWFVGQAVAPLLRAAAPQAFGDWVTDRHARRPSGARARGVYRDPVYHLPNFRVILEELALTADDNLLEVACGGGALLKQALANGCRASAVDHSADMVRLAREQNRDAVASGRLVVEVAKAERLPFPDATFTCAAMTGVLGFLPDPVAALAEIRRVLAPGGRFVGLGSDPELRGTPAAPEPMASRLRFYGADELTELARRAGFADVRVVGRELERFAREAGVPEDRLALFKGSARFLLAVKSKA